MVFTMKITIISVGKIKEKYFSQAIQEYSKRLGRYCQLKLVEVADEKAPERLSMAEMEQLKEREGERILKYLRGDQHCITLEITGKVYSSTQLAKKMNLLAIDRKSNLAFIIGGSLGLAKTITNLADESISFSSMTFPHQLMKIILLEQIYRTYRINRNEPYHK